MCILSPEYKVMSPQECIPERAACRVPACDGPRRAPAIRDAAQLQLLPPANIPPRGDVARAVFA